MKFKKLMALGLSLSLAMGMMVACGKTVEPEPEPEPEIVEEPEEIKEPEIVKTEVVFAYFDDELTSYYREFESKYESKNETIDIVLKQSSAEDYIAGLEKGTAPGDVFLINEDMAGFIKDNNLAKNLDSSLNKLSIDTENYCESVIALFSSDEELFAIPLFYEVPGLWYNKELFDNANLAYPDESYSWMSMLDSAGTLTNPSEQIFGLSAGYADKYGIYVTIPAVGGYVVDETGTTTGFSLASTKGGVRCWADLMETGYSPSQNLLLEKDGLTRFKEGQIAMIYGSSSLARELDDCFDVTCVTTLTGDRCVPLMGAGYCVKADSTVEKEAMDFLKLLVSDEAYETFADTGYAIPAASFAQEYFVTDVYKDFHLSILLDEATNNSYPYPTYSFMSQWNSVIEENLLEAYKLNITVDEAAMKICQELDSATPTEQETADGANG